MVWGDVLCSKNILTSVGFLILSMHGGLKGKKFKHKQCKPISKMGAEVLECGADAVTRLLEDPVSGTAFTNDLDGIMNSMLAKFSGGTIAYL